MNLRFMFAFSLLEHNQSRTLRISPRRNLAFVLSILGAFLNLLAIFLPWSVATTYFYLPWSPVFSFSSDVLVYPETIEFALVVFASRLATIAGWIGIILSEYTEKYGILRNIVLLVSGLFSFLSVGVFAIVDSNLSWGALFSLAGGALIVSGMVLYNTLEISIEIE